MVDILGYLNLTNSMICGFAMLCRQIGISLLHQWIQWILSLGPKKMDTPIWPTKCLVADPQCLAMSQFNSPCAIYICGVV